MDVQGVFDHCRFYLVAAAYDHALGASGDVDLELLVLVFKIIENQHAINVFRLAISQ